MGVALRGGCHLSSLSLSFYLSRIKPTTTPKSPRSADLDFVLRRRNRLLFGDDDSRQSPLSYPSLLVVENPSSPLVRTARIYCSQMTRFLLLPDGSQAHLSRWRYCHRSPLAVVASTIASSSPMVAEMVRNTIPIHLVYDSVLNYIFIPFWFNPLNHLLMMFETNSSLLIEWWFVKNLTMFLFLYCPCLVETSLLIVTLWCFNSLLVWFELFCWWWLCAFWYIDVWIWWSYCSVWVVSGRCPLAYTFRFAASLARYVVFHVCFITLGSDVVPAPYLVKSSPCNSTSSLVVLITVDIKMAVGYLPFGRGCLSCGVGGSVKVGVPVCGCGLIMVLPWFRGGWRCLLDWTSIGSSHTFRLFYLSLIFVLVFFITVFTDVVTFCRVGYLHSIVL